MSTTAINGKNRQAGIHDIGGAPAAPDRPAGACQHKPLHADHGPTCATTMTPSTAIHTIVTGMNTFQPSRMIWS